MKKRYTSNVNTDYEVTNEKCLYMRKKDHLRMGVSGPLFGWGMKSTADGNWRIFKRF